MTAKLVSVFGVCFSVNFLVFFSSFGGWEYAFSERTTFFSTCHGFPFMKNVRTPEISRTLLEVAFEGVACLRADARRGVIVFFSLLARARSLRLCGSTFRAESACRCLCCVHILHCTCVFRGSVRDFHPHAVGTSCLRRMRGFFFVSTFRALSTISPGLVRIVALLADAVRRLADSLLQWSRARQVSL